METINSQLKVSNMQALLLDSHNSITQISRKGIIQFRLMQTTAQRLRSILELLDLKKELKIYPGQAQSIQCLNIQISSSITILKSSPYQINHAIKI